MIKIVGNNTPNCAPVSSSCVIWKGPNIPCLEIETGDELDAVVTVIAEKVCELAEPFDLNDLSLSALLQICGQTEPVERTLINVLQLMIDNNVCLKELIDSILVRLGILEGANTFTINLGCLGSVDGFGNPTEVDEEQLLQLLVNNICAMKSDIADIQLRLVDLQNQINNIATEFEVVEPDIATCVNPASLPTSQQVISVANEVCQIRDDLGTTGELATALGLLCNLDAQFVGNPDWIPTATVQNAAQLLNNLTLLGCNLNGRVTNIEENCCALTCEDIKLGFSIVAGATANTIIVRFRGIDGTFIPNGFENCAPGLDGSTVLITDANGDQEQYAIELANEFISEELDVSGLDLSKPLSVSVQAKLCNDVYNCSQCLNRSFNFNGAGCPVCLVTTAGEGTVTITYQLP